MKPSRSQVLWLVLALLAAGSMAHYTFAIWGADQPAHFSDLYAPWWGAHELLLRSRNPYSPEVAHEIQTMIYGEPVAPSPDDPAGIGGGFAYPPWVAFLLWPTLYLSFPAAQKVFVCVAIAAMLLSLWLWLRALHLHASPLHSLIIAIFLLGTFPVLQGLELQNLSLIAAALIAITLYLISTRRLVLAGIFLAASTFKPQFVVALIPWLTIWTFAGWRRRRPLAWSFLASMAVLILAGEWRLPGSLRGFLHVIRAYRHYTYGHSLLDVWLTPRFGVIASLALLLAAWAWCWPDRSQPADSPRFLRAASLLLAGTVVVIPTLAPHAQLLLLPGMLCLLRDRTVLLSSNLFFRLLLVAVWALLAWPWLGTCGLQVARLWQPVSELHRFWQLPLYSSPVLPLAVLAALVPLTRRAIAGTPVTIAEPSAT